MQGLGKGLAQAAGETNGLWAGGLFVIHNPAAGARHPERLRRRVETVLSARRVDFAYAYTEDRGHAQELALNALDTGYERFLVAGGDGTILEVVSALVETDASLALLPVGTGNQLAANMRLPRGIQQSIEVALKGGVRKIDVGILDGQPFTCIAGAGFDADVVRPDSAMKRRVGYLAYVHSAASSAFSPKPSTMRITVDGDERTVRGIGVEVANMPGLTAPMLPRPVDLVPDGRPDDGLLDVCVLAVETTFDFVTAMTSIMTGRQERDQRLQYFRGREVSVEADPPLPVQVDGEVLDRTTPFVATVKPGALSLVVPA
jgi:diacylglycerol kinase (ATP)